MQIVFSYGIGYGRHEDSFEIEDDAPDEEIEEMVRDAVIENLDWGWAKESTNE